jgi:EmrB/QacA subfamily drug resistance transporter
VIIVGLKDSHRARWIALVVVCLGQLMSVVDASIVNVALTPIQHALRFSQANLTWVVNGYLISYGSFLLLAGRLGDLIGRKRIFLGGVTLFTLSSALCGLAQSQAMLIAARFVQGLGGAGATSAIVAIIATEFQDSRERAQAMSVYTFVVSGGASLGLVLGGLITQSISWHWIFYINVPIGIFTVIMGRRWIIENEGLGIGRDLDVAGAVMVTASAMLGAYAIVSSTSHGWGSAHTLGFLVAALVLVVAFVTLQLRLRNPIMPLRIFKARGLAASCGVRGLLVTGMYSTFFLGVLYLEHVHGYSTLRTGLAFLPQTIVLAFLSTGPTAKLVNRYGSRGPLMAGLASCAAGLAILTQLGQHSAYAPALLIAFLFVGLGAGLAFMPLLHLSMEDVPLEDAGLASGIINFSLQLSAAMGVAILGTISTDRTKSLAADGHSQLSALLGGYHLGFDVAIGAVILAAFVAALTMRGGRETADDDLALATEPA